MADHFLDATKKVDFIRRDEVHVQIERALCEGLPYHRTIDEIPAADVRPVVRGKWVRGNENRTSPIKDSYICSVCGEKTLSGFCGNPAKTNFCPNCGAEMKPNLDTTKGDNHD